MRLEENPGVLEDLPFAKHCAGPSRKEHHLLMLFLGVSYLYSKLHNLYSEANSGESEKIFCLRPGRLSGGKAPVHVRILTVREASSGDEVLLASSGRIFMGKQ